MLSLTNQAHASGPVSFQEAMNILRSQRMMKFNETIEVSLNIATKASVSIRGFIKAPKPLNRDIKIAAFTNSSVNADYSGVDELIERFTTGEIKKCDICLSDRHSLPLVARKIGRILGRKRIMPDVKFGTVVDDISSLVDDLRHGVMFYRSDKAGKASVVHSIIGKVSMVDQDLEENIKALLKSVQSSMPEKSSIKSIYISKTMGDSVSIDMKGLLA